MDLNIFQAIGAVAIHIILGSGVLIYNRKNVEKAKNNIRTLFFKPRMVKGIPEEGMPEEGMKKKVMKGKLMKGESKIEKISRVKYIIEEGMAEDELKYFNTWILNDF